MTAPSPAVIVAARAAQAKWHIPASISIAQYAVESGWGAHMPPGSNNPFGIKALPGQECVSVSTREVDKYGRDYYINAAFRKFASIAEAFDEHGQLLAQAGAYAKARACLPNANDFADALTGVYATDPHYGDTLKAVMWGSKLHQYDEPLASIAALFCKPVPVAFSTIVQSPFPEWRNESPVASSVLKDSLTTAAPPTVKAYTFADASPAISATDALNDAELARHR